MTIEERIASMASPHCDALHLELVETQWVKESGRRILRLTIDNAAGVSHEDCVALSQQLDSYLDKADFLNESYQLEVSSPGAERRLRTAEDFLRFAGRRILVKCRRPMFGQSEWRGQLLRANTQTIVLDAEGSEVAIPRDLVTRVQLSID